MVDHAARMSANAATATQRTDVLPFMVSLLLVVGSVFRFVVSERQEITPTSVILPVRAVDVALPVCDRPTQYSATPLRSYSRRLIVSSHLRVLGEPISTTRSGAP